MEKELYKFENEKYEIHGYIIDKIPSDIEIYKEYGDLEDEDITKWLFKIGDKHITILCNDSSYNLDEDKILVDDNILYVVAAYNFYKIDLDTLECLRYEDFIDDYEACNKIEKFNKGVIIYGECEVQYFYGKNDSRSFTAMNGISSLINLDDELLIIESDGTQVTITDTFKAIYDYEL